jgi:hypothetical protein
MVPTNRPPRPVTIRFFTALAGICLLFACAGTIEAAEPAPIRVEFLPMANTAVAVSAPDSRHLVSVYTEAAGLTKAHRIQGSVKTVLTFSGQDKVTRLCFFKNPKPGVGADWKESFGDGTPQALRAIEESSEAKCTFQGWVTQVGDKVLPLGLLNVAFQGNIPPAGTPLVDSKGSIVGLILQPSSQRSAYAIPAQAVRRVQRDIDNNQKLVRGWLGISLSTESSIPRITRIWPDSPAAKANLKENDILVKAGPYPTDRYPDAVNALFYTIPGKPTRIEIVRGDKRISSTITPTVQKPGN